MASPSPTGCVHTRVHPRGQLRFLDFHRVQPTLGGGAAASVREKKKTKNKKELDAGLGLRCPEWPLTHVWRRLPDEGLA